MFIWGEDTFFPWDNDPSLIPAGYETQLDLPPGEYILQLVLSDGSKFGRIETPLTVERYDQKQLDASSVVLCKRYHNATEGPRQEDGTIVDPGPDLLPLATKDVIFTPAGDTRFKRSEPMFVYFEVYQPQADKGSAPNVGTRLRITNAKSGELKVDTGFRNAADWVQPGRLAIPIGEKIDIERLPKGQYRLEVQATDSEGRSTPWRAASFTIE